MDAFYTKIPKMSKNQLGDFDEWDIIIYVLAKCYIINEHKDTHILDIFNEIKC